MEELLLQRIQIDPTVMMGKPVIRGTRLTVEYIIGLIGHGATIEDIVAEHPGLYREDILACIVFSRKIR